jgi:hypothetical protein
MIADAFDAQATGSRVEYRVLRLPIRGPKSACR